MSLDARLRRLETGVSLDPVPSPFLVWAGTLPLEDVRALRDYLRASVEVESPEVLATGARYRRGRELLALAPEAR